MHSACTDKDPINHSLPLPATGTSTGASTSPRAEIGPFPLANQNVPYNEAPPSPPQISWVERHTLAIARRSCSIAKRKATTQGKPHRLSPSMRAHPPCTNTHTPSHLLPPASIPTTRNNKRRAAATNRQARPGHATHSARSLPYACELIAGSQFDADHPSRAAKAWHLQLQSRR